MISQEAKNLDCALSLDLCSHRDCVLWADNIIAQEENPRYELIEIACSVRLEDCFRPLEIISQNADHPKALRTNLGRVHYICSNNPSLLSHFASHLYSYYVECEYNVPDFLHAFLRLDGQYELAFDKIGYTVEELDKEFLELLSKFKKQNSHHDNWYCDEGSDP